MPADPTWFGAGPRPLFGWVHTPEDSMARGGVLLCPPVGRELLGSSAGLRGLAEDLAGAGFVVVRFDYRGTGDSAGDLSDPKIVDEWLASIAAARGLLTDAGVSWTAMVGLRLGANLAVAAAHQAPVDRLVLWDPYRSGTDFLREQRALHSIKFGDIPPAPDGAVEIPGFSLPAKAIEHLEAMKLGQVVPAAAPAVLVLLPPTSPTRRFWDKVAADGGSIDESPDIEDLLVEGRPAPRSSQRITAWLAAQTDGRAPVVAPRPEAHAVVERGPDGTAIHERSVRLGEVGLFGIITEPSGPAHGPTVVFFNTGVEAQLGPSRAWVTLSRRLAACGYRSLRFNLSGLGDSSTRPGQERGLAYPPEAVDDITEVLGEIAGPGTEGAVLVGLCSGGYTAIEAGLRLEVRGVVAFNPVLNVALDAAVFDGRRVDRWGMTPRRRLTRALRDIEVLKTWSRSLPAPVWSVLHHTHVQRYPAAALGRLVGRGVQTLVVCGIESARPYRLQSAPLLRRLEASEVFDFVVVEDLDNTFLTRAPREVILDLFVDYVRRVYGPSGAAPTESVSSPDGPPASRPLDS